MSKISIQYAKALGSGIQNKSQEEIAHTYQCQKRRPLLVLGKPVQILSLVFSLIVFVQVLNEPQLYL